MDNHIEDFKVSDTRRQIQQQQQRQISELIVEIDRQLAGLPRNTKTRVIRDQFFRLFNYIHSLDIVSFAPPVVVIDGEATSKQ